MINVVVSMSSNYQVCVTILKISFIICIMVRCCEHLSPLTLQHGKIHQPQNVAVLYYEDRARLGLVKIMMRRIIRQDKQG